MSNHLRHPAESGHARQAAFAILAVVLSVITAGCQTIPPGERGQRIVWRVSVGERFVDPTAHELVRLPTRFEGRETWWVSDDMISIETRGGLPNGRVSENRTWILPAEGMVYVADYKEGRIRAIRFERFDEERRRRSRAALVATIRTIAAGPGHSELHRYSGDLSSEGHGRRQRLSALPGREWLLVSDRPGRVAWSLYPLLAMGFEDVSESEARPLARRLAIRDPRSIIMQPLPTGEVSVRLHYKVRSVRWIRADEARSDLPSGVVERARRRERRLADFGLLWGFWVDRSTRPRDLDLRGLRVRMEPFVAPEHRVQIETRLDESESIEEIEELLHLLYVLDAFVFDKWYAAAREAVDLPRILACISVLSLRQPGRGLVDEIGQVLDDTKLYEGLSSDQKREARTWFEGVRHWVAHRRPVATSGGTTRIHE